MLYPIVLSSKSARPIPSRGDRLEAVIVGLCMDDLFRILGTGENKTVV